MAGKRIVLLYPSGGLLPIRAWPLESYCRLAEELLHLFAAVTPVALVAIRDPWHIDVGEQVEIGRARA